MATKAEYVALDKLVVHKHVEIVRVVKDVIIVMRTVMTAKAVTQLKDVIHAMAAATQAIIQKTVVMKILHVVAASVVILLAKPTSHSHAHIVMVAVTNHKAATHAIRVTVEAVTMQTVTRVVTAIHATHARDAKAATGRMNHAVAVNSPRYEVSTRSTP